MTHFTLSEWIDSISLVIIVLQGFVVCYFEWGVYKLHSERADERKKWRDAKRRQQTKVQNVQQPAPESTVYPEKTV